MKVKWIMLLPVAILVIGVAFMGCGEDSPTAAANKAPTISSTIANPSTVSPEGTCTLTCSASDPDGDDLTYTWDNSNVGSWVSGNTGQSVDWKTPADAGNYTITVTVEDGNEHSVMGSVSVKVEAGANQAPVIASVTATPSSVPTEGTTTLSCTASDPEGDPITYSWNLNGIGEWVGGNSMQSVQWKAPNTTGSYTINVTVRDNKGNSTSGDVVITVELAPGTERLFDLGNSGIKMAMIWVPAGKFTMGSDFSEYEKPAHEVTIASGFWMGKYEVTQEQYVAIEAEGYNPSYNVGDNNPVEGVTWNIIRSWILLLNAEEAGSPWRLPSEAEWEFVLRAGTDSKYFWGYLDDNIEDYAVFGLGDVGSTASVGTKDPNPWGLYDMLGNVWEWCEDWYHQTYNGAPTDGSAWISPSSDTRVIRGGSYYEDNMAFVRSSGRFYADPSEGSINWGFRLVRIP